VVLNSSCPVVGNGLGPCTSELQAPEIRRPTRPHLLRDSLEWLITSSTQTNLTWTLIHSTNRSGFECCCTPRFWIRLGGHPGSQPSRTASCLACQCQPRGTKDPSWACLLRGPFRCRRLKPVRHVANARAAVHLMTGVTRRRDVGYYDHYDPPPLIQCPALSYGPPCLSRMRGRNAVERKDINAA
jgi:hypothetical protein